MCLIALALGISDRWPLVLASNRDEFHSRPTAPLARWTTPHGVDVVSGRDLLAGGTWLGVTPDGRLAAVTNVRRGVSARGALSRGDLALAWLTGGQSIEAFTAAIDPEAYGGFNLILGDHAAARWFYVSNAGAGLLPGELVVRGLAPGLYGLSNAALDVPWPKTVRLKQRLQQALHDAADLPALQATLLEALADRSCAPAADLPETGVSAEAESSLSAAFVDMSGVGYGTRCSTVVTLDAESNLTLREVLYGADGGKAGRSADSFCW